MALERIVDKLDISQKNGIFSAPLQLEKELSIWINKTRNLVTELPLIIEDEISYTREGVALKLKTTRASVAKNLAKTGLIRKLNNEDFSYKPGVSEYVSPLSMAQTMSWLFNTPIENVLINRQKIQQKIANKKPKEKMDYLFEIYSGTFWFDSFIERQKSIAQNVKTPTIGKYRRISLEDLEDWFICNNAQDSPLRKLVENGFIIPAKGKFSTYSPSNIIDNNYFAEFLSKIYPNGDAKSFLSNSDDYVNKLTDIFVEKRLNSYMKKKGIEHDKKYTIKECAEFINQEYRKTYRAAWNGTLHHSKNNHNEIYGIDLAIFALKKTEKLSFSQNELDKLFGTKLNNNEFGIKQSDKGTYAAKNYVFPVFDLIAKKSREKLFRNNKTRKIEYTPDIDITLKNGEMFHLPANVARSYVRQYGFSKFDDSCKKHLYEQLNSAKNRNGNGILETVDLIFKIDGNKINEIAIRNDSLPWYNPINGTS